MLRVLKENEHVKYLPAISLDRRLVYVVPRQIILQRELYDPSILL